MGLTIVPDNGLMSNKFARLLHFIYIYDTEWE